MLPQAGNRPDICPVSQNVELDAILGGGVRRLQVRKRLSGSQDQAALEELVRLRILLEVTVRLDAQRGKPPLERAAGQQLLQTQKLIAVQCLLETRRAEISANALRKIL